MLRTTETPKLDTAQPGSSTTPVESVASDKPTIRHGVRWKKWAKRFCCAAVGFVVLLAIGGAWALHVMEQADEQHARFLESGKGVNAFLKSYSQSLAAAHGGHSDGVIGFYDDAYDSPGRGHWDLVAAGKPGDASLETLAVVDTANFDIGTLQQELDKYLQGLASIDRVKCKINLIEDVVPGDHVTLTVKYILDGTHHDGRLLQDRFFFRWYLVAAPDSQAASSSLPNWKIVRDELVEGVRVSGRGDGFQAVDLKSAGIDYSHARDPKLDPDKTQLKFGVIQHAAGGVAAVDYDRDGAVDVFFPDGVKSRLYRNLNSTASGSDISFEDVTDAVGLGNLDQATCGLFADFDGDRDLDLFVCRYFAPCRLYINDGNGHFQDRAFDYGLNYEGPCVSACLIDYNGDGRLDVYLGVNGNAYDEAPNIPFYATNAQPNVLFRNDGTKFVDVTETAGVGTTGWTLAVAAADYNGDGHVDLGVANDFGRKVLYHNNGNGTFTDAAKRAGVLDFSGGMGLAFADLNDDGHVDLYTSNINSNQRWFGEEQTIWQYNSNLVRTKWIFQDFGHYYELYKLLGDDWRGLGQQIGEGNSLFFNNGDGTLTERKDCNATRAGWSWGVALFDMENDSDLDVYACNGWVSGKKKDDL